MSNPGAGFIQGPFRDEVERIARAHPLMPADEVIRRARGNIPRSIATTTSPNPGPSPKPAPVTVTELQFEF